MRDCNAHHLLAPRPQNEATGKSITRAEALLAVWSLAMGSDGQVRRSLLLQPAAPCWHAMSSSRGSYLLRMLIAQREEVFKAQIQPLVVGLLDPTRSSQVERWAACGLLLTLAQSEKHIAEVVSARVRLGGEAIAQCCVNMPHAAPAQPAKSR